MKVFSVLSSLLLLSSTFSFTSLANEQTTAVVKKSPGDRPNDVMEEVVPKELIPKAPILTIEQALESFHVHQDFELQVVAKEPLIFDPIIIEYDAAGRVWAVEMTTFMPDVEGNNEFLKQSQIVVLTDTNNDGEMDKRQVVVEKIVLPRAFAFIDKGILWANNESLFFSELSEKDGEFTHVKTEMVDKTYAKGGNLEHKTNGLLFNLDNWYYSAKSDKRYRAYPLTANIPSDSKEIYRNTYWKMVRAKSEFRGQFGLSQDDYGRLYFNHNSTPLQTTSFLPNIAQRNKKHKFPPTLLKQAVGTTDVYPVRVNPGINRGYQRSNYREDFSLKNHTAACGPLIYRGDQYPAEYYGIGLVQEPAGNLIKANKLVEKNGVVTGSNLFDKQEIVASTDERFRPVNARNAPDGTITLVDFYHGILQHRTFLTSYLADQIKQRDLERNRHIGRLYRLKYKNSPLSKVDYLDGLSAIELVPFLAHSNGWHRDMAQQLLVMKQGHSAVPALTEMAKNHDNHLAQIKALWTLEGLGVVELATLTQAAENAHSQVKQSAYRLAEFLAPSANVNQWLLVQARHVDQFAANALVFALARHQVWSGMSIIVNQFGVNDFVIASLAEQELNFLNAQGKQGVLALSQTTVDRILAVANFQTKEKVKKALTPAMKASFERGKAMYHGEVGCFGCHGADGDGNAIIPPVNNSEWVTGAEQRLIAILLHGFTGPITVNKQKFNSPMTMPGLDNNNAIDDQDLADIATYIRNEWQNSASPITPEMVSKIRRKTKTQTSPYTQESIKALD